MKVEKLFSAVAVVLAAAALVIALTHSGPRGEAGPQGPQGAQGLRGAQGLAGKETNVEQIKSCLPEFTRWIQGFNVQTEWQSGNEGVQWLTSAYLDTTRQQVSESCQKVLGMAPQGD